MIHNIRVYVHVYDRVKTDELNVCQLRVQIEISTRAPEEHPNNESVGPKAVIYVDDPYIRSKRRVVCLRNTYSVRKRIIGIYMYRDSFT